MRFRFTAKLHECPVCGSCLVRHSHKRSVLEQIVCLALFLQVYRCDKCDARFSSSRGVKRSSGVVGLATCFVGDAFDIWDEVPSLTFGHYRTNPCLSGCVSDSFNLQYGEQD
jgi:transposase-like protein